METVAATEVIQVSVKADISNDELRPSVCINGKEIDSDRAYALVSSYTEQVISDAWISVKDSALVEYFLSLERKDFSPEIAVLNFGYYESGFPLISVTYRVSLKPDYQSTNGTIRLEFNFDIDEWNLPWGIGAYKDRVEQEARQSGLFDIIDDESLTITLAYKKGFPSAGVTIGEAISDALDSAGVFHTKARVALESEQYAGSVALRFEFPEAIRVPCEQYLLYFADFLKDAGVSAAADLKHQAGQVLFTVTPDAPGEALEKIRAALEVYLHLPANPSLFQTPVYGESFEVQRLLTELHGFHMKLGLANMQLQAQAAALEAKNATIQAKDAAIFNLAMQLRGSTFTPITPEVFVHSVRAVAAGQADGSVEPILGGAVEIAKFQGKGYNINAPLIFRWVRGLFKKGNDSDSPGSELLPPGQ